MIREKLPPGFESVDHLAENIAASTGGKIIRVRGDEMVISPCPFCEKPGDKFSINRKSGAWNCKRCDERGGAYSIVKHLRIGPVAPAGPRRQITPPGPKVAQEAIQETYRGERPGLESAESFLLNRGLTLKTARAWGCCVRRSKGRSLVGLPYHRMNGRIAFVKYRDVSDKSNMWRWPKKDALPEPADPLFGGARLDLEKPVVLTEGEFDAMALWQCGIRNVASISGGVSHWADEWSELLVSCETIYCAFDDDDDGESAYRSLLDRFPSGVVKRVRFGGCNDANAALIDGWGESDFKRAIAEATMDRPKILSSARDVAERILEREKAEGPSKPILTGWRDFDETQKGLRLGELSVITAHTGMGKTCWTLDLALRLAERGVPVAYMSLEQGQDDTVRQLVSVQRRQTWDTMRDDERTSAVEYIPSDFYVGKEPVGDRLKAVSDAIRFSSMVYGVRFAVVDHLDYIIDTQGREGRYEAANRAILEIQRVTQECKINTLLICQPTSDSGRGKDAGEAISWPRLAHMAESRLTRQIPNNGFIWASDKENRVSFLGVEKARYMGARESMTLKFKFDGFRYSNIGVLTGLRFK